MNQEKIDKLCDGRVLKSSLEIYALLDGSKSTIENLAQSMHEQGSIKNRIETEDYRLRKGYKYNKY